jgi:hypothetical protein
VARSTTATRTRFANPIHERAVLIGSGSPTGAEVATEERLIHCHDMRVALTAERRRQLEAEAHRYRLVRSTGEARRGAAASWTLVPILHHVLDAVVRARSNRS